MLYDPGNRWHMANVGRLTEAVLFDRDGTLVRDVPYNGDPDAVVVMPGAREALDRLRAGGVRLGVVTNQSGIARGRLTRAQGDAGHVLAVRSDSAGDVLLTGPALRALAAGADRLTLLCGPRGEAAADLLPGVDELISWHTPWIDPEPKPVDPVKVNALVDRIAGLAVDEAGVFTSFHQSPPPFALLLRLARVLRVSAGRVGYPGALLDA